MTPEQEIRAAAAAALATVAQDELRAAAGTFAQATGRLPDLAPDVTGLSWDQLVHMETQAQAWTAAMKIVRRWCLPGKGRPLARLLKTLDPEESAELERLLNLAGVWKR